MAPILNYASQIQLAEFELFGVQKFWVGAVRYTKISLRLLAFDRIPSNRCQNHRKSESATPRPYIPLYDWFDRLIRISSSESVDGNMRMRFATRGASWMLHYKPFRRPRLVFGRSPPGKSCRPLVVPSGLGLDRTHIFRKYVSIRGGVLL